MQSKLALMIIASIGGISAPVLGAGAADYPNRIVRFILPQPGGSGTDTILRTITAKLTQTWGQQVIVDNRPGANGIIGVQALAKAKPDGYTLLYGFTSMLTINPSVYKNLPYNPLRDFEAVTQLVTNTMALVVNPHLPARSVKDLVALGRARPGDLLYGSFGVGNQTHLTAELFRLESGLKMLHVPYKGATPAVTELIGGQVVMMFVSSANATPHIKTGRLRLLATCGPKRSTVFPDTPTMVEAGFPRVVSTGWGGIVAPGGTPPDIVKKIQQDIAHALADPQVRERLSSIGSDPEGTTPEAFASWLRAETEKWEKVVKGAGLYHRY
jgi:tripartite-type tricarboxylate transporter receptor subunit TctC